MRSSVLVGTLATVAGGDTCSVHLTPIETAIKELTGADGTSLLIDACLDARTENLLRFLTTLPLAVGRRFAALAYAVLKELAGADGTCLSRMAVFHACPEGTPSLSVALLFAVCRRAAFLPEASSKDFTGPDDALVLGAALGKTCTEGPFRTLVADRPAR